MVMLVTMYGGGGSGVPLASRWCWYPPRVVVIIVYGGDGGVAVLSGSGGVPTVW